MLLYEHAADRDREAESTGIRRNPGAGRDHAAGGVGDDLFAADAAAAVEVGGVAHTIPCT